MDRMKERLRTKGGEKIQPRVKVYMNANTHHPHQFYLVFMCSLSISITLVLLWKSEILIRFAYVCNVFLFLVFFVFFFSVSLDIFKAVP